MSFPTRSEDVIVQKDRGELVARPPSDCAGAGAGAGVGCTVDIVDVTCFGADGTGKVDDTAGIKRAIEFAEANQKDVFFPGGWYFISDTLPFYSNMTWWGEGALDQERYPLSVDEVVDNGSTMTLVIADADKDIISYKMRDGDPIDTQGFADSGNNGLFSVDSVDPANGTITINNSNAVSTTNASGTVNARISEGGSVITFRNLNDGSLATGNRFIDERGRRQVGMRDMGFAGPGINSVFGGGIRFRRSDVYTAEALSGYVFDNVGLEHSAMEGIEFGQVIASSFQDMRIERCVEDGLRMVPESGIGGATTSCRFDSIFVRGTRRGIVGEIIVYCSFANCVAEGSSCGYYMERAIGCSYDSCASETIKHGFSSGRGQGATFRFVDSYGCILTGPTIYYNTELDDWNKAAIEVIDGAGRTESPTIEVRGGHLHQSLQERVRLTATEVANNTELYWYLDVSNSPSYEPQSSGDTDGDWLKNTFINEGDMVAAANAGTKDFFTTPNFYEIQEIDHWPRDESTITNNATTFSREPTNTDDASAGFVQFSNTDGLWIDDTSDPGYWVCIDDTTDDAEWIKWSASWFYRADYPESLTNQAPTNPTSSEAWAISPGRQVGADFILEQTQRVYRSYYDPGVSQAKFEIDPLDFLSANYLVSANYDPWTNNDTRTYSIKDNKELDTINGKLYWVIRLIVPSSIASNLNNWSNSWVDVRSDDPRKYLEFRTNGLDNAYVIDYIYEDEPNEEWLAAVPIADNFLDTGEVIDIFKPRLNGFEGEWTVDSLSWKDSGLYSSTAPVIEATCSPNEGQAPDENGNVVNFHRDDAIVALPKFSQPPVSEVVFSGTSHTHIYDPQEAAIVEGGREFEAEFQAGNATTSVDIPTANIYKYDGYFEGSFTQLRKLSNDFYKVTLERDDTTNTETATVRAYRKKSPGYDLIMGKVNDGSLDFSPDAP